MLMKLTTGLNCINIFVQKSFVQIFSNYSLALDFFWRKNICVKAACKKLMKLTTDVFHSFTLWHTTMWRKSAQVKFSLDITKTILKAALYNHLFMISTT